MLPCFLLSQSNSIADFYSTCISILLYSRVAAQLEHQASSIFSSPCILNYISKSMLGGPCINKSERQFKSSFFTFELNLEDTMVTHYDLESFRPCYQKLVNAWLTRIMSIRSCLMVVLGIEHPLGIYFYQICSANRNMKIIHRALRGSLSSSSFTSAPHCIEVSYKHHGGIIMRFTYNRAPNSLHARSSLCL